MVPAILGKKIGMTQVFDEAGVDYPVTVVQAGPCAVLQVKHAQSEQAGGKSDGYEAVQLGFEETKPRRARKPQRGHAAKAGAKPVKLIREIRLDEACPAEIRPYEIRLDEVGLGEVGVDEVGRGEVRPGEDCLAKVLLSKDRL